MTLRHPDITPVHPGEFLREDVLPELPFGKAEFARRLGVSRQHLYAIINEERPITTEFAAKLGKLIGNGPRIWLHLQADYDAWYAKEIDVSDIPTLEMTR